MKRSLFLPALTAALAAGSPLRAQTPPPATTITVGVIPAEVAAEAFYGYERGFFKQNGLDVQLQPFNNGPAIAAAVASGTLDIGLSDLLSVIDAHARGVPFVFLAPGVANKNTADESTFGLLVRPAEPIKQAKDLNGLTFATNALDNIGELFAKAWIDANGGDSKTTKWIELPYPSLVPALTNNSVQVVGTNEPWMSIGVHRGARAIYFEHNAIAPEVMLSGWVTTRDWLQKNPATAAKFVAAIRDTARWANRNHELSAPILARYALIPELIVDEIHRSDFAVTFDPRLIDPVIAAAARYGLIDRPFPATEIMRFQ
jgi:NitT/TauT family transport system substrate-binding protein